MKRTMVVMTAMAILLTMAGTAMAGGTQNVNVTANIVGTCQFNSAGDVAFGALDQTSTADQTATGSLVFWCTKNATYTLSDETNVGVADGSFTGTLTGPPTGSITYTLTYTNSSGSGAGKTSPITSAITGTILNADYVNAPAGNYTDTVTFTIAP
jgi:spore coat protein U-like protein